MLIAYLSKTKCNSLILVALTITPQTIKAKAKFNFVVKTALSKAVV